MGGAAMTASANAKLQALILFAHGARDPRWAAPFERLAERLREMQPHVRVELAFLELMTPRLPECVDALAADGYVDVSVIPVFLGQGGHVLRDLPLLLDQIRQAHPQLALRVAPAVGEDDSVQEAMARYCLGVLGSGAD
jgi:sirohydrochlorin cobaltochelatase